MQDFTLTIYKNLLTELIQAGYRFVTFVDYIQDSDRKEKTLILRHDVDKNPFRSLRTAELENDFGIKGTYNFRVIKNNLPSAVITQITKLGHEIGYHYDDLNAARGDVKKAMDSFQKNLAQLRELATVRTACMHGSPLSSHDNREMWKNNDYREFGIIGEPYFDINFNEVMYLTDTGRRWDGDRVSIRDRVPGDRREVAQISTDFGCSHYDFNQYDEQLKSSSETITNCGGKNLSVSSGTREARGNGEDRGQKTEDKRQKEKECRGAVCDPPVPHLHSTMDIINALNKDLLPDKIMMTIHPQRWVDNYFLWTKELIWQNVKNGVKYFLVR